MRPALAAFCVAARNLLEDLLGWGVLLAIVVTLVVVPWWAGLATLVGLWWWLVGSRP